MTHLNHVSNFTYPCDIGNFEEVTQHGRFMQQKLFKAQVTFSSFGLGEFKSEAVIITAALPFLVFSSDTKPVPEEVTRENGDGSVRRVEREDGGNDHQIVKI